MRQVANTPLMPHITRHCRHTFINDIEIIGAETRTVSSPTVTI